MPSLVDYGMESPSLQCGCAKRTGLYGVEWRSLRLRSLWCETPELAVWSRGACCVEWPSLLCGVAASLGCRVEWQSLLDCGVMWQSSWCGVAELMVWSSNELTVWSGSELTVWSGVAS